MTAALADTRSAAMPERRGARQHRVNFFIDDVTAQALREASADDGITISDRFRALFVLWQRQSDVRDQVRDLAREIHQADVAQRWGGRLK